jgi:hypothetical protein
MEASWSVIESSPRLARVSGRSGSWAVRSQRQRRGLVFTPSDEPAGEPTYGSFELEQ